MCAQFIIAGNLKKAAQQAGLEWKNLDENFIETLIVPHKNQAPIFLKHSVQKMTFSLVPSWSKTKRPKFATHNARLFSENRKELIYQKPTWREPFAKRHCLVPIMKFIEPIYTGPYAGNMVKFGQSDRSVLFAAGLWDSWVDKESGEILDTFTIITHDPPPFIENIGHDRSPLFLKEEAGNDWLSAESKTSEEWVPWLVAHIKKITFEADIHRPMAKGWEKRI